MYQRWGGGILFGASYHVGLAVYLWVCRKQKQRRLRPPAPGRPQAARLRGGRHENEEAPRTTAEGPVTAAGLLPEAGPRRAHMGRCPSRQRAASGRRSGPARVRGPSRGHAACRCRPDRSSALRSGARPPHAGPSGEPAPPCLAGSQLNLALLLKSTFYNTFLT